MRLPRWLVILLMTASVAGPIALALWLRIAPDLTMKRFVSLVSAGEYEDANKMLTNARWVSAGNYIAFEADEARCSFPPDYWLRSMSGSNIEVSPRSLSDWSGGQRTFSIKENVFLVKLRFDVGTRKVTFGGLCPYQKEAQPEVYKELSIYSFDAKVSSINPLRIDGTYTFGDPEGGFCVLIANGEERDRCSVCIGNGHFTLSWNAPILETISYCIQLTDQDGVVRKKVEKVLNR
jgi:hypothetical protein